MNLPFVCYDLRLDILSAALSQATSIRWQMDIMTINAIMNKPPATTLSSKVRTSITSPYLRLILTKEDLLALLRGTSQLPTTGGRGCTL